MIFNVEHKDCPECSDISVVKCKLDTKLAQLAKQEFLSLAYGIKSNTASRIAILSKYSDILSNLYWNSTYYCKPYKDILSRVKQLINGSA